MLQTKPPYKYSPPSLYISIILILPSGLFLPSPPFPFEDGMILLPFADHLIHQVFPSTAAERVILHLYSYI